MFGRLFSSRQRARPITLYLFTFGDNPGAYHAHTDAERAVVHDGINYTPAPIQHGNIVASGTLDKSLLEVKTSRKSKAAQLFQSYPPTSIITLRIFRGNHGDSEFVTMWFGEVKSCKLEKSEATFSCEPLSTLLMHPGLRRNYQVGCPLILYGSQCRVNKDDWKQTAHVDTIEGQHLNLNDGWNTRGIDPNRFLGGLVQWAGVSSRYDYRVILRVFNENAFLLGGIPFAVEAGGSVEIAPGCNHQISGCSAFNNIHNYGGCPWIPFQNPIGLVDNFF